MNLIDIWEVFKNSSMTDIDMQKAFARACTPNAVISLLEERDNLLKVVKSPWIPLADVELEERYYHIAIDNPDKFGYTYETVYCNGRTFHKNSRWDVAFVIPVQSP